MAGAAILTALAVLLRPEAPIWKGLLWGGVGVFTACACVVALAFLRPYPTDVVRLACTRCDRKGQYRKAALIVRFGKYMTLPDLRVLLANCDRHGKLGDACEVHYVGLSPRDGFDRAARR
jgi:hypothetical protein